MEELIKQTINKILFQTEYNNDDDKSYTQLHDLIKKNGWLKIYSIIFELLKTLNNREEIKKFTNNYFCYDLSELYIDNPYEFLGYILVIYDKKDNEEYGNFDGLFDGVYIDVLLSSNIADDKTMFEFDYETDSKLLDEIEKIKSKRNN